MKQKLQKIAFYYFVIASVAAYLITIVSVFADLNWFEYLVSPVHPYCQLLAAGSLFGRPLAIILSLLPLLFVGVSFVLYHIRNENYTLPIRPVLLGNIVLLASYAIILVIGMLLLDGEAGNMNPDGPTVVFLLSSMLQIALWIVLFWRKRS